MTFQLTATKDCGTITVIYGTSARAMKARATMAAKGYIATVAIILPTPAGVWS